MIESFVKRTALLATVALLAPGTVQGQSANISQSDLEAFRPRSIGPAVTVGRVHDLEA